MAMTMDAGATPSYPVTFDVQRPESQSRITNFPLGIGLFIRYILLIPHFIVVAFVAIIAFLLFFFATFAILFTGVYPRGMYNFVVGYLRWSANVGGYLNHLYDVYPAFSTEAKPGYPLSFDVIYPEKSSRLLNFPIFGVYIKYLLLVPHVIVLLFLGLAGFVVLFIAPFAILFTGAFPEGMHRFIVGINRWSIRIQAYVLGLTDKYPPFSTD